MVEQIAQVDSRFMIGGTNWVGLAVPLHCSALGKVLLAYGAAELPPGRLRPRTPKTITSRADLHAELAQVRKRGYAVTDAELEPGLVAVAAPVFAGGPVAVAAISVSGPSARLTARKIPAVASKCVAAASGLSDVLGVPLTVASSQTEGAA
jgi:IclR family transcriptional regulator, acetate operon repressor